MSIRCLFQYQLVVELWWIYILYNGYLLHFLYFMRYRSFFINSHLSRSILKLFYGEYLIFNFSRRIILNPLINCRAKCWVELLFIPTSTKSISEFAYEEDFFCKPVFLHLNLYCVWVAKSAFSIDRYHKLIKS